MQLLYNIGIYVYGLLTAIAALFSSKAEKRYKGAKNALLYLENNCDKNAHYIWFHAASLGEFEQGRPIIESIRNNYPDYKILLTFFSPSGYEVRSNYVGADLICYLPLDTPSNARRFLKIVQPKKAIFIKYEYWGNFLRILKHNKVPTYMISAIYRKKQIFFRWYGSYFRKLLRCFCQIFVQDSNSQQLLNNIGIESTVAGDTRFDRVVDIAESAKQLPIVEAFAQNADVIVAGSTWPTDEQLLTRYINANKEKKMIIVPHEVDDEHIAKICNSLRRSYVLYTETNSTDAANADCLIVNTIGLLSSIYRYGRIAYIGGGFGVGIHNILEAAVWGVPVVFGPNYHKFREAHQLIATGDGHDINSFRQLETLFNQLFFDKDAGKRAAQYVRDNCGATQLIMKQLFTNNM